MKLVELRKLLNTYDATKGYFRIGPRSDSEQISSLRTYISSLEITALYQEDSDVLYSDFKKFLRNMNSSVLLDDDFFQKKSKSAKLFKAWIAADTSAKINQDKSCSTELEEWEALESIGVKKSSINTIASVSVLKDVNSYQREILMLLGSKILERIGLFEIDKYFMLRNSDLCGSLAKFLINHLSKKDFVIEHKHLICLQHRIEAKMSNFISLDVAQIKIEPLTITLDKVLPYIHEFLNTEKYLSLTLLLEVAESLDPRGIKDAREFIMTQLEILGIDNKGVFNQVIDRFNQADDVCQRRSDSTLELGVSVRLL